MTTTYNSADNSSGTLSNGDLTVSFNTVPGWQSIRSTNSPAKTSGKYHFEFTAVAEDASNGVILGMANSSSDLNSYIGSSSASAGVQPFANSTNIRIWSNSGSSDYTAASNNADGDVWAIEVDIDNLLFWVQRVTNATGWTNGAAGFTGNPGAGTGGTSFSGINVSGGLMLAASGVSLPGPDTNTMNPGPTFALTPSSGFSSWDAPASDTLMGVSILSL